MSTLSQDRTALAHIVVSDDDPIILSAVRAIDVLR